MLSGYAKAISTAIGAGLTAAISYYPHAGWIPIAVAVCTVLATYAVANTQKPPPAATPATSPATVAQRLTIHGDLQSSDTPMGVPDTIPASPEPTFLERVNIT